MKIILKYNQCASLKQSKVSFEQVYNSMSFGGINFQALLRIGQFLLRIYQFFPIQLQIRVQIHCKKIKVCDF